MSKHNIPFSVYKENQPKLSQAIGCSDWIFSKGLKGEFETAVVNKPSVIQPQKFYCTLQWLLRSEYGWA